MTIKTVLREPYLFKGMIVIGPAIIPNPDAVARWKVCNWPSVCIWYRSINGLQLVQL